MDIYGKLISRSRQQKVNNYYKILNSFTDIFRYRYKLFIYNQPHNKEIFMRSCGFFIKNEIFIPCPIENSAGSTKDRY